MSEASFLVSLKFSPWIPFKDTLSPPLLPCYADTPGGIRRQDELGEILREIAELEEQALSGLTSAIFFSDFRSGLEELRFFRIELKSVKI